MKNLKLIFFPYISTSNSTKSKWLMGS